jgi:hypothetical protein
MENTRVYQPWSAPLLHFNLSEDQIEDLLKITDLILSDKNKKSYNDKLAGEIESEWEIEDHKTLSDILCVSELSDEYFEVFHTQCNFDVDSGEIDQPLAIFAMNLQKSVLVSAWFNDQKDNEYNPIHNHTGVLSGVLYLKIPEYLPSRKTKDTDGAISFIGNETATESIMTNSTLTISPEKGDLFLFPSSLKHQVYPFRTADGNGIRRSMSFNIK